MELCGDSRDAFYVLADALFTSMAICDDYKAEIDATVEFVDNNLKEHGITYPVRPKNGL